MHHHLDRWAHDLARNVADGDLNELLPTRIVAQLIHVSVQWLEIGRLPDSKDPSKHRYGPKFVRLNKRMIRYRRGDVLEWLRSRSEQPEVKG